MRLDRPVGRMNKCDGYIEGSVLTPHGIVTGYAQGSDTESHHTSLSVIVNGRMYTRSWPKRYSARGIVTLAARFAAEMAEQP
jgi:hypothetical protein